MFQIFSDKKQFCLQSPLNRVGISPYRFLARIISDNVN